MEIKAITGSQLSMHGYLTKNTKNFVNDLFLYKAGTMIREANLDKVPIDTCMLTQLKTAKNSILANLEKFVKSLHKDIGLDVKYKGNAREKTPENFDELILISKKLNVKIPIRDTYSGIMSEDLQFEDNILKVSRKEVTGLQGSCSLMVYANSLFTLEKISNKLAEKTDPKIINSAFLDIAADSLKEADFANIFGFVNPFKVLKQAGRVDKFATEIGHSDVFAKENAKFFLKNQRMDEINRRLETRKIKKLVKNNKKTAKKIINS